MLFPEASSALLYPYLQCMQNSVVTVSRLPIARAVWLAGCFCWFVWDCIPLPPLPLHILAVWGLFPVLPVCSHVGSFPWPGYFSFFSPLFSFLYFNGFHHHYYYSYCYFYFTLVYFDLLSVNVFQSDWCPFLCCLNFIVSPFTGAEAHGWLLHTTWEVLSGRGWVDGQL